MPFRSPAWVVALDLALRAAGGRRLLSGSWKSRIAGIGVSRREADRVLASIRSVSDWHAAWDRRAAEGVERGLRAAAAGEPARARAEWRVAGGATLLSMALTDPLSAARRRCHRRAREIHDLLAGLGGRPLESFSAASGRERGRGFLRLPDGSGPHPLVLMLPPLGHAKEELGMAFEPLLAAGYALAGLDLPGGGDNPGPLPLNAQRLGSAALDLLLDRPEVDSRRVALLGISLGAYWAFKIAAEDRRPGFVVGISTPVMDRRQWRRLPPRLWRAFQASFATADRRATRTLATQMTLEGVFQRVRCPALLFHGDRDAIPIRRTIPWLLARAGGPVEVIRFPRARHGCVDHLDRDILPAVRDRLAGALAAAAPPRRRAAGTP